MEFVVGLNPAIGLLFIEKFGSLGPVVVSILMNKVMAAQG